MALAKVHISSKFTLEKKARLTRRYSLKQWKWPGDQSRQISKHLCKSSQPTTRIYLECMNILVDNEVRGGGYCATGHIPRYDTSIHWETSKRARHRELNDRESAKEGGQASEGGDHLGQQ